MSRQEGRFQPGMAECLRPAGISGVSPTSAAVFHCALTVAQTEAGHCNKCHLTAVTQNRVGGAPPRGRSKMFCETFWWLYKQIKDRGSLIIIFGFIRKNILDRLGFLISESVTSSPGSVHVQFEQEWANYSPIRGTFKLFNPAG